ncbi:MAG: response regulator [bacterium]|nr:response regulator [bacterium]
MKVLIVDDEEDIINLLKIAFEGLNANVITLKSGSNVVDTLKKEKPDVMLLDVMLPEKDGYTIMMELSSDEETKKTPVYIITALHPVKDLFEKFQQVRGFITKPFDAIQVAKNIISEKSKE